MSELCESDEIIEGEIENFEGADDLSQSEEVLTSANQYQKAIDIYEKIALHSLYNNSLKYGVKEHLMIAGLCKLCKNDHVTIGYALERYWDVAKFPNAIKEFDSMALLVNAKNMQLS